MSLFTAGDDTASVVGVAGGGRPRSHPPDGPAQLGVGRGREVDDLS
jgi:hypothetical protein